MYRILIQGFKKRKNFLYYIKFNQIIIEFNEKINSFFKITYNKEFLALNAVNR